MRNAFVKAIVPLTCGALVVVLFAVHPLQARQQSAPAAKPVAKPAGPVPRLADGKPDMTGVWGPMGFGNNDGLADLEKLYTPAARAQQQKLEDSKTDVGWGHQIRSYVLDQSRIKDLRTNVEISNTQKVLDGDLDPFIEASLKQGV